MDRIRPNWAKVNQGRPNGLKWTNLIKWTEMDRSRPDGPNYLMNWTEWIE